MTNLEELITTACDELFGLSKQPQLTRPEEQFGDFACNIALQLAKELKQAPKQVAEQIKAYLEANNDGSLAKVEVAGPGFLNMFLADSEFSRTLEQATQKANFGRNNLYKNQTVVAEYSDPNPFKELHAGHLYTSVVGDAIASLVEAAGAKVHRVNFGGDVGLHVAKAMWGIVEELGGETPDKLAKVTDDKRANWLAKAYVAGNQAYEDDPAAKQKIITYNKQVYQLQADDDHSSPFAKIYWTCRQWSYDYFDDFYARIGTKFEKYYPESLTTPIGLAIVQDQKQKGVFKESKGAVVFNGEDYDLHTRVFITSEGLPTYETKDVGLIFTKWEDYKFDRSIVITGNDIIEYMKVVLAAISQFEPGLPKRTTHLTHGIVKLKGKGKMSSRSGNVLRAVEVLDGVAKAVEATNGSSDNQVTLGAIKYAFLKPRLGGDIIFDIQESVSLEGNSGPYLQYAHARAQSILRKSQLSTQAPKDAKFEKDERSLLRKISQYPEVVELATRELNPHHICTFLYELAQVFNRFYENNRVIGNKRQDLRLSLVQAYATTLKNGLELLNIPAPDQM